MKNQNSASDYQKRNYFFCSKMKKTLLFQKNEFYFDNIVSLLTLFHPLGRAVFGSLKLARVEYGKKNFQNRSFEVLCVGIIWAT